MKIPTNQIEKNAVPRDRFAICGEALSELQSSIALNGLRLPVKVYKTDTGYGLISGYRRLLAYCALHEMSGKDTYTEIDAVVRETRDDNHAMAQMVEENEIRESLSPWDRSRIAVVARGVISFDTPGSHRGP